MTILGTLCPPRARLLPRLGLLAAFFVLLPLTARAQGLLLSDVELLHQDGRLAIEFSVALEDPEKVRNLLLDGASLLLECRGELMGKRSYWFNDDLTEHLLVSHLKSDSLTREFFVTLPGQDRPLTERKLQPLVRRAWTSLRIDLGPDLQLAAGETYEVELTTTLKYADVPPWLKQTLFFWSWEVAPPSTRSIVFTH